MNGSPARSAKKKLNWDGGMARRGDLKLTEFNLMMIMMMMMLKRISKINNRTGLTIQRLYTSLNVCAGLSFCCFKFNY